MGRPKACYKGPWLRVVRIYLGLEDQHGVEAPCWALLLGVPFKLVIRSLPTSQVLHCVGNAETGGSAGPSVHAIIEISGTGPGCRYW